MGIEWILISIFAVAIAFLVWKNRQSPGDVKRMETLLEKFIDEMEEQNGLILQSISNTEEKWAQKVRELEEKIERLEKGSKPSGEIPDDPPKEGQPKEDQLHLHQRYQRIFDLHQSGLTTAEIARAVGSGKGEIELILQLSRMNETDKKE